MLFPSLAPLYRPQPRNYMAVHPTTVGELFRTQLDLHPTVRQQTGKLFGQMQEGIQEESGTREYFEELDNRILMRMFAPMLEDERGAERVEYDLRMAHPLYCSSEVIQANLLFSVNISLPDKLLLTQFRDSMQRARTYVSRAVRPSTHLPTYPTSTWIKRQLLPFIDLSFDKHLAGGCALSRAEITELIWPSALPNERQDEKWDSQSLKDTTESLVEELMADYSEPFWTLQAKVAALLAEPSLDLPASEHLNSALQKPVTRRSRGKNK
jgi:hypothetical protein